MRCYIHVEECGGHNQSVVVIEADDLRAALHIAADRIIKCYTEDNGGPYEKEELDWGGYPHPGIMIIARDDHDHQKADNIEELRAVNFWEEISDPLPDSDVVVLDDDLDGGGPYATVRPRGPM